MWYCLVSYFTSEKCNDTKAHWVDCNEGVQHCRLLSCVMSSLCEMIFCNCMPAQRRLKLLQNHVYRKYNTQTWFLDVTMCVLSDVRKFLVFIIFVGFVTVAVLGSGATSQTLLSATTSIMLSWKRSSRVWRKRTTNCKQWLVYSYSLSWPFSELVWIISLNFTQWAKSLDIAVNGVIFTIVE